jgi:hypothetical protein
MAQAVGRNSAVEIWDTAGTCRNLSGDMNNVVLTWTKDNPESTTFGKDTKQRLSSIRDATLTGAGIWNGSANAIDATLTAILAASANTLVAYAPGGSITGCALYSACMQLQSYSVTGPLNGPVAIAYSFQVSSGSVTVGTAV